MRTRYTICLARARARVCVYLCVATDAAASRANCLMTLSSKYFCSHLVMSASKAKILSSFSRRCSIRAVVLYSGPVGFCEPPDLCAEQTVGMFRVKDKISGHVEVGVSSGFTRAHHETIFLKKIPHIQHTPRFNTNRSLRPLFYGLVVGFTSVHVHALDR